MLIVTGTGRSGTSVIATWLKELGLMDNLTDWVQQNNSGYDTRDVARVNSAIVLGNDPAMQSIPAQSEAIRGFQHEIVKDPLFFYGNALNTWLDVRRDFKVLICLRKFQHVHKSRLRVQQHNLAFDPDKLRMELGKFMSELLFNEIPYEVITFPSFLDSYDEVYGKIKALYPAIEDKVEIEFGREAWESIVKKNLVHYR